MQSKTQLTSNPAARFVGGMGRMGAGRDGFVHLFARAGARLAGIAAQIGDSRDARKPGVLRRDSFRGLYRRLGRRPCLGADCRPVWPRTNADVHDPVFFPVYVFGRLLHECLDAGYFPLPRRCWNWRRVVHGTAIFISEEWPEKRRTMGAAIMHTGYYFGFFLAALANYFIGSRFGWRYMFVVGAAPALLVAFNYNRIREPERWNTKQKVLGHSWTLRRFFLAIFSRISP